MKSISLLLFFALLATNLAAQNPRYDDYFTSERLRLDLIFTGDAEHQQLSLQELRKEAQWGGSKTQLIDIMEYGNYYVKVFSSDNILLYSKGFSTLFQEWRTTAEAKERQKSYQGTVWVPFPKQKVSVVFYERVFASNQFKEWQRITVDPADKLIRKDAPAFFPVTAYQKSGDPAVKADIVFVAEGYTAAEMSKFRADVARFTDYLFKTAPYDKRKSDFNIWMVESASGESGVDIPQDNIWKRTAMAASFHTFYVDRYLTINDQTTIADMVSGVPCDAVFVIANSPKYGGGGIYNFYGMGTADNELALIVFVHEFGHSFAGLGDEYYSSAVAYEEFYNLKTEPWEPNITTLVDFKSKWQDMIAPGTPQPTPNEEKYHSVTGLFEGGGYVDKGVYRPAHDCRMKSNVAPGFCPVCQKAISRMIDTYCK